MGEPMGDDVEAFLEWLADQPPMLGCDLLEAIGRYEAETARKIEAREAETRAALRGKADG